MSPGSRKSSRMLIVERGAQKYIWNIAHNVMERRGGGDGPGAKGLDPKPAVHADLPLSDYSG